LSISAGIRYENILSTSSFGSDSSDGLRLVGGESRHESRDDGCAEHGLWWHDLVVMLQNECGSRDVKGFNAEERLLTE
jgi:hypothetical protein